MRKYKGLTVLLLLIFTCFGLGVFEKETKSINIQAATTNERMLKATWVSPFVSDVVSFNSETLFKSKLTTVLNSLEAYGYNALIFHVRIHNNALYPSIYNPKSTYVSNINFNTFDPLTWLVNETHKRGMEFHAWLNPYRPAEGRYTGTMPSTNPESDSSNLLTGSEGSKILDPSKYVVKAHIVNTVKEIITNYDVDAIHFDDYFYVPYSGLTIAQKTSHVNSMIEMVHNAITTHNTTNNKHVQFGISPTGIYKNGNGSVTYSNGKVTSTGSATTGQEHGNSYICADTLHWMNEGWIDYIMPQIYWQRGHSHGDFSKVLNWWNQVASYLDVNLYVGLGLYMASSNEWGSDNYELSAQLTLIENATYAKGYSIYSYKRFTDTNATITQMKNAYDGARSDRRNISVLPEIKSMTPIIPDNLSASHTNGNLSWNSVSNAKFYYLFRSTGTLTYSDSEIFAVVDKNTLNYQTSDYSNNYNYGVKVLSPTNHLSGQSVDDPINITYTINYHLNGGSLKGYKTKAEISEAFLTDLYTFIGPSESLIEFMHGAGETSGFNGTWFTNDEHRRKIYGINIKSGNDSYFLSSSTYQAKWEPLANFMVSFVAVNSAQSFWGSASTGTLRMNQYFRGVKPSAAWSDSDMAAMPTGLSQTVLYTYDKNTETFSLPTVEKTNNTFLGWYTTSDFAGSAITSVVKGSTGNKVFYAKWQDNTPITYYSVTFNLGYNDQVLQTLQVASNGLAARPTNPTRDGYTFLGWYEGSSLYDFSKAVTKNTSLTASWQQINIPIEDYNVTFNLNYDSLTLPTQIISKGSKVLKPTDPVRSGYIFNGWFNGTSLYDFNSAVTSNLNLIASWIYEDPVDLVTVTFDYGYGAIKETKTIERYTKVSMPTNPSRPGYTFVQWNFGYNEYDFNNLVNYNIVLIAVWAEEVEPVINVVVTFSYGYNNITETITIPEGTKVNKPTDPTRSGYDFVRWDFAHNPYDFNSLVHYSITLIAQWQEKTSSNDYVVVELDLGYDEIKITRDVIRGEKVLRPTDPVREDYIFVGWYFVNELYDFDKVVNYGITLIAKWEKEEVPAIYVKVTFDHGYNNIKDIVSIAIGAKVSKPTDPVRYGYKFIRWTYGYNAYDFDEVVSYDIVLIANWEEEPTAYVTITLDFGYEMTKETKTIILGTALDKPSDPNRSGYKFMGWYYNNELYDFNNVVNYNIVLIANWEKEEDPTVYVTITLDYGYEKTKETKTIILGTALDKPADPVRDNFKFIGWNYGGSVYNFNELVNYDIILIAQWEVLIKTYKVIFNIGYSGVLPYEVIVNEGYKVNPPFTPYKEGYLFTGWYNENTKYDFTQVVENNINLTAKWELVKAVKDVSVYGKSEIRTNSQNAEKDLIFYGIKNKEYKNFEHGFYLVYGRTTNSELLNAIENNLKINNKKVFKVVVEGLLKDGTYCVVLTGIPKANYDDVITVVPYVLKANKITLASEPSVSSVNHTVAQNNGVVLASPTLYIEEFGKRKYL